MSSAKRNAKRNLRKPSVSALRFAEEVVDQAGILDEDVADTLVDAFSRVPRERFVESGLQLSAYQDDALPIGFGQTISRPSTVARMLGLVGLQRGMRVLEVGCGSGYCSAVMAAAGASVFAIECIGLLAQQTRRRLDALDYHNILIKTGDGRRGWIEHAPYDAIVLSAAFEQVDPDLVGQLINPGGRMVAPVGDSRGQILTLWEAKGGGVTMYQLEPCVFVEGR